MSDRRPSRRAALLLWCAALSGQFCTSGLLRLFGGALGQLSAAAYNFIASAVFYLIFLGLPVLLYMRRRPGLFRAASHPNPISVGDTIALSATAVLGLFFFNYLTVLWMLLLERLGINPGETSLILPHSRSGLILTVFSVAAMPGALEELLFRGAVLPAFERSGTRRAIWLAAILFTLTHGTLAGLPTQLLVGAMLGMIAVDFDSIYASMIYHTVHNAASIVLQLMADRIEPTAAVDPNASMLAIVGGAQGVIVLLGMVLILGGALLGVMKGFHRRAQRRGIQYLPRQRQPRERGEILLWALDIGLCAMLYAVVYSIL